MSFFECQNVNIYTADKKITSSISFTLDENETLAIIGRTGSGKTMTALSIMGLLPPNVNMSGDILYQGIKLSDKDRRAMLGKDIVYIPQNGHEFLSPSIRVKSQMKDTLKRLGIKEDIREDLLAQAGFEQPKDILRMYPYELSGGMAQRVTLAMALASNASIVIADEATNGLNYQDALDFIGRLKELFPESGRIVITHDLKVAGMCDHILVMHNGKMVLSGSASEVLESTHPYIVSLVNAMPENGMKTTTLYEEDKV